MKGLDEFLLGTCRLAVQHILNYSTFRQLRLDESGWAPMYGRHSRFLETLLHPEEVLIFKGYSRALYEQLMANEPGVKVARYREHIVPMGYLIDQIETFLLDEENPMAPEEAARVMCRNLGIAYITVDEARYLDHECKLKICMPDEWCLKAGDPIERLRKGNIELVDKDGNAVTTLKMSFDY